MNQKSFKACFNDKKWTYVFGLNPVCLPGKCSIRKGLSEIGLVLVVFSVLFWILIPMMTFYMEMRSVQTFKEQVKTASELALTDMILTLDPVALSTGNRQFKTDYQRTYHQLLTEKLKKSIGDVAPENLVVLWHKEGTFDLWEVGFDVLYVSKFSSLKIFNQRYHASFQYEMPFNN